MPESWYLVTTKAGEQDRAEYHLNAQNINTYLPRIKVEKARGKVSVEPVFAGYVFVHIDPSITSVKSISYTRGCSGLVSFGGVPAECPSAIVESLKSKFDTDEVISLIPKKGDRVEIHSGQLAGLQAIYQEPDKRERSNLLIEILGKLQRVSVKDENFALLHS